MIAKLATIAEIRKEMGAIRCLREGLPRPC
jgi:hypothetical protein